jgi:hypothetical protein
VGCAFFALPLGMLVTTCHDLAMNCIQLHQAWKENDSAKAREVGLQILNNAIYLGLFFTASLEVLVASLAFQVLVGLYQTSDEFRKGKYLEVGAGLLMVAVRMNQMAKPLSTLHTKLKATIQNKRQAIISCNTAKSDIGVSPSPSPEAIEILVKYSNNPLKMTPLNYTIEKGDLHAAKILIDAGLGLNAIDNGATPAIRLLNLIRSSGGQHRIATELFYKILTKGIDFHLTLPDINLQTNQGQQLLILALWVPNSTDILELLLNHYKIDPNFQIGHKKFIQFLIESQYIILYPDKLQVLLNHLVKLNDLDCFSEFWIYSVPITNIHEYSANFKKSISLLINHGANPRRGSTHNPKITAIDKLLKNVIALPQSQEASVFKKEIIPFLVSIGAQIV